MTKFSLLVFTVFCLASVWAEMNFRDVRQAGSGRRLSAAINAINRFTAYALPDGAELLVGQIKKTFTCENRIYGYYADVDNNCQIFHICVNYLDVDNNVDATLQYSFLCGNQTIFDQRSLSCAPFEAATPCVEAPSLYDVVNSRFGVIDR